MAFKRKQKKLLMRLERHKYEKEIKYIEDNLKEYLYDYTFLKEKK